MIEKREIEVAKELSDVMKLITEIIVVIKNKGDYTSLMDELINAISGIDQIPAELKTNPEAFVNTVLVDTNKLVWTLVGNPFEKKEEVAVEA